MNKYLIFFRQQWSTVLAYPVSFWLWRLRNFLTTFTAISLWSIIFTNNASAFDYTSSQMLSYIFLTAVLQSLVLSTALGGLAQEIYSGNISNLFIRPVRPLLIFLTQEAADKTANFMFMLVELTVLYFVFQPSIYSPNTLQLMLFIFSLVLGIALFFVISLLLGVAGFWSPETWAPRFLLWVFLEFTTGKLYPLDIFPQVVQKIVFLTPLPYLTYVQTQIFLGKFSVEEASRVIGIQVFWIVTGAVFFLMCWRKGLKEYGAMGR